MDKFIKVYDNAIPEDFCDYFVDFFEKEHKKGHTWAGTNATTVNTDGSGGATVKKEYKDSTDCGVRYNWITKQVYAAPKHTIIVGNIMDLIYNKFEEYVVDCYPPDHLSQFKEENENIFYMHPPGAAGFGEVIMRYEPPEQGYHRYHSDWSSASPGSALRMVAGIVYLNDVKEGGETDFYHQKLKVKPKKGTLIVFPAGYTHLHKGNNPISNTKYILSLWGTPKI